MRNLAAVFAAALAKSRPTGANPLGDVLSPEERTHFVRSILGLSAARGFATIPLIDFFGATGLPTEAVYDRANRALLYDLVHDHWDSRLMATANPGPQMAETDGNPADEGPVTPTGSVRDALFDLAMNRFEAMEETRQGAISLLDWPLRSLSGPPVMAGTALRTARRLFFLAGQDSLPADPRHAALAIVLWRGERAWRADESGDFARLMARLDGDLRRLEDLARRMARFTRPGSTKRA